MTPTDVFPYYPYDPTHSNDPTKSRANRCQTINSNSKNVFVAKYVSTTAPSTYNLAYVDYLGGGNNDFGYAVAADAAGNAYVTGRTSGTDFPITNQGQTRHKGPTDAFVAKVNFGADGCVDPLYATTGAYSTSLAGNYDGFVTKLGNMQSGSIPWHAQHSIDLGAGLSLDLDLSDGHVDLHAEGMDLPGRGPDLVVNQTWDSTLAQQGATSGAGAGWVSTLTPAIGGSITGTLTYTDGEGTVWPFLYLGSITATLPYTDYQTPAGYPWALTATTSGYSLTNILSSEVLNFDTSGRYFKDVDAYGNATTLTYDSSGPISSTNSGGRAIALVNSSGRLTDVKSWDWLTSNGTGTGAQQLTYSYNGSGQLTQLTRGAGTSQAVTTTFGYSGTQLTTITTPLNQSWSLGYDSQGRISDVASPVSGTVGQAGYTPAYLTAIGYNAIQTTLIQGYGAAGQQITIYSLDASGEPEVTTDGLGHSSVAFYDGDHDPVYQQDADRHATTTYYQYVGPNASTGLVTETVQPAIAADVPGNQALSPVQTFHYYNATNDLTETVSPAGGTMLYGYDGHHSVLTTTQQINPLPCATTPCPAQANQWQGTVNSYDQFGELTSVTDGRGVSVSSAGVATLNSNPALVAAATRHMTYYTIGDLKSEGTPPITTTLNGQLQASTPVTTTYAYNADGRLTQQTTPNGATTLTNNDHLGRPQSVQEPPVTLYTGSTVTPTDYTTYDGDGRVATQTDANTHVTLSSYDPLSRLTAETNAISGTTVYTYNATEPTAVQDPLGNVTTSQYDAAGRLTQQTSPVNGTVQYQDDPVGNTIAMTTGAGTNVVQTEALGYNALNQVMTDTISGPGQPPTTTLTAYNLNGGVAQVQNPDGDVVYNTYDAAGRLLTTETDPAPVSPSALNPNKYDSYSYDGAGNTTLHVDADGRAGTMQYDGDNRVVQSVDATSAPTGTTTITTTPGYDPDGNTITQTTQTADTTTPGVVATHTYTEAVNAADWTTSTGDDGLVTAYGYDTAGQRHTETVIDGQTPVTTALDAEGRAIAIGENVRSSGPYTSSFAYNADDLPVTVTLNSNHSASQVQQVATYDPESRLTHLVASGALTDTYDYAYQNGTDWTTAMTWTVNGVVTATQLTHNALGRLTNWSGQIHGPESWAYDGNGNIISNTEFISDAIRTTAFTYSTTISNQLSQQQTAGLGVESYTYDQSGDTTSLVSTDPAFYPNGQVDPYHVNIHVGYDAQERPITVTTLMNGAPITATLGYNAQGQRDRYTVVSGTTTLRDERFSYRHDELGQDVVVSGTQTYTDTFIYDQNGSPLELVRQQNGTTSRYWYVLDGQGNVVALVDTNGNVVDRYAYDPWGEGLPEGTVETVRQPLRYAGYWWDTEVGWYWVSSRYYDPEGRWLQPDKSELDGIHTYVYVNDDPVDFSDPLGLGTNPQPCFLVSPTKTMCETGKTGSASNIATACVARFRDCLDYISAVATIYAIGLAFVPGLQPVAGILEGVSLTATILGTAIDAQKLHDHPNWGNFSAVVLDVGSFGFTKAGEKIIDYAVTSQPDEALQAALKSGAPQAVISRLKVEISDQKELAHKLAKVLVEPKALVIDWTNHELGIMNESSNDTPSTNNVGSTPLLGGGTLQTQDAVPAPVIHGHLYMVMLERIKSGRGRG